MLLFSVLCVLVATLALFSETHAVEHENSMKIDPEHFTKQAEELKEQMDAQFKTANKNTRSMAEKLDGTMEETLSRIKKYQESAKLEADAVSARVAELSSHRTRPAIDTDYQEKLNKHRQQAEESIRKSKERAEQSRNAAQSMIRAQRELHEKTNRGRAAFPSRDDDIANAPRAEGETRTLLETNKVSDRVVQEVSRLASANVPRETMVDHIRDHFPNKNEEGLNDIVAASLSAAKKDIPKSSLDRAKKHERSFQNMQYQRSKLSKERLEAKADQL